MAVFGAPPPPPAVAFVVVWDVVVAEPDACDEDTDFKYFNESQCDLYSIGVFGGKFNTRRNVSRIRVVQL